MKSVQKKSAKLLLAFAVFVFAFACEKKAPEQMSVEEMVTVNGHKLNTRITGSGSSTVIFLSGAESPLGIWSHIQDGISVPGKMLAYDRAGYAASDPVSETRDGIVVISELRALLDAKKLPPPYLLVAHSLAGPFAQLFAAKYKYETRGIVLVDCPSDEEMLLTGQIPSGQFDQIFSQLQYTGTRAEIKSMGKTMQQLQNMGGLPDLPLIVITNLLPEDGETKTQKQEDSLAQKRWLDGKSAAKQWFTNKGHLVPLNEPDLITKAIIELLK